MVFSIIHGMPTLCWCLILMAFVIFTFANIFIYSIMEMLIMKELDAKTEADLDELYGGLWIACLTLFRGIAGGNDWIDLVTPLSHAHWLLELAFYLYIFFMVFGV